MPVSVSLVSLRHLAGPILDKELRVLSRRMSTYAVRAAYLLFLAVQVAVLWFVWIRPAAAQVVTASRMSDVAAAAVARIVWFQFIAAQVLAVVLAAGVIHEEVRKGTLDSLFASGISSTQIVLGKVSSRVLPIVMVLCTGLPLLGMVGFWGGVPWDYVIAATCVTLTAALALAVLGLFLSLSGAHAHRVVVAGAVILVICYAAGSLVYRSTLAPATIWDWLCMLDPFAVSLALYSVAFGGGGTSVAWETHCGLMLMLSAGVLAATIALLRRAVAARHPSGCGVIRGLVSLLWTHHPSGSRRRADCGALRQVTGSAVLWKDYGASPAGRAILHVGLGILVGAALVGSAWAGWVDRSVLALAVTGWWLVLSVYTACLASLSISQEREAWSWPVLLATPLTTIQIMRGKACAVLLRTLFGWSVYLVCTVAYQVMTNWMMGWDLMLPLWAMAALNPFVWASLVTATGLYVGLRCRTAFTAVLVTLAAMAGFIFLRQNVIPLVAVWSRYRLGPWLSYHALNLIVEAVMAAVLFVLTGRGLRRYVF